MSKKPSQNIMFSTALIGNAADGPGQPKHENHMKIQLVKPCSQGSEPAVLCVESNCSWRMNFSCFVTSFICHLKKKNGHL